MSQKLSVFSLIFPQDTLDVLFTRSDEFRRLSLSLQRFFSENYKNLEQLSRSIIRTSDILLEYISRFTYKELNCYHLSKNLTTFLRHFGEDSSTLYNSLSSEINLNLNQILDNISRNKRSELEALIYQLSEYNGMELKYSQILQSYKIMVRDTEEMLIRWQDSLKEAKSLYNMSANSRNMQKIKKSVDKIQKYERKLDLLVIAINQKRRDFIVKVFETLNSFEKTYEAVLRELLELWKKHSDALCSFISLFTQTFHENKESFNSLKSLNWGYPSSCRIALIDPPNDQSPNVQKFPDFIENPNQVKDLNLIDYADWVLDYLESIYKTAEERRKILKHTKQAMVDMVSEHENCGKLLAKTLKNVILSVSWSIFGEEIFAGSEKVVQIFETITKKLINFANYALVKLAPIDSILFELRGELKLSQTMTTKSLKEHTSVRNTLMKAQNSSAKLSKIKDAASNIKDLQNLTRTSMIETAKIIKGQVEELNDSEKKRIESFKTNISHIIEQIENYFSDLTIYLKSINVQDRLIEIDVQKIFLKVISTEAKLEELYGNSFKEQMLLLKEKDIQFISEFNPQTHPLYLKLVARSAADDPELSSSIRPSIISNQDSPILNKDPDFILERKNGINTEQLIPDSSMEKDRTVNNLQNGVPMVSQESLDSPKPIIIRRKKSLENLNISPGKEIKLFNNGNPESSERRNTNSIIDPENLDRQIDKSINFDLSSSPKKKKSTYAFFANKFGLVNDEIVVSVFSCALMDRMLIQGKIFVSNKKLAFHSYFNKHTFIGETKMIIPRSDISKIEKRYNALIFDNSIAIITTRGELFFTSFVFRDKAYACIVKTLRPPEQKDINSFNENQNIVEENESKAQEELEPMPISGGAPGLDPSPSSLVGEIQKDPELTQKLNDRKVKINDILPKSEMFTEHKFSFKVPWTSRIEDVYRIIFSGEKFSYKDKDYNGFWEYLKAEKCEDTNIIISDFEPKPPLFYQSSTNLDKLPSEPLVSTRNIEFIHPVRKTGIPLMPKSCPVKELQKIFWINDKEFRVFSEVRTEKIPYSDSFYTGVQYTVTENDGKIEVGFKFGLVWVKQTIMKKTIEKKVISETIESTNEVTLPVMKEILKYRLNSQDYKDKYGSKVAAGPGNDNSGGKNENQNNVDNEEFENLKKEVENQKKEIKEIRENAKKTEIGVLVLIIFNISVFLYVVIRWMLF